jgi:hypothetical protein
MFIKAIAIGGTKVPGKARTSNGPHRSVIAARRRLTERVAAAWVEVRHPAALSPEPVSLWRNRAKRRNARAQGKEYQKRR